MTSETKRLIQTLNDNADRNLAEQLVNIDSSRKYVLFADDNPAVLSLMSVFMQSHGLNNFILSENINSAMSVITRLNGGFHHIVGIAVLDIDFGVMGGNINDLIKILIKKDVPVIVYSAMKHWQKYILPEFIGQVSFIQKGSKNELIDIYQKVVESIGLSAK